MGKQELTKMQSQLDEAKEKVEKTVENAELACDALVTTKMGIVSAAIRDSMKSQSVKIDAVFKELASEEGNAISQDSFSGYIDSLEGCTITVEQKDLLLQREFKDG